MACQSACLDRVAILRRICLILLKTSSIGFRSGEYGGRYSNSAPADSINSRTRSPLWLDRLSITTTSPGRNSGTRTCSTNASKTSRLTEPSTTVEHRIPSSPSAAISVVVCQCVKGTRSTRRAPRGDRPRSRVILVFAQVSSMKINRLASMCLDQSFQKARFAATSGRSCSAAWIVFF